MENSLAQNFEQYIRNNKPKNSSIKFPEDKFVGPPNLIKDIIKREEELSQFFGAKIPRIINGASFKVIAEAGGGSQSTVVVAQDKTTDELVVVKLPKTFAVQADDDVALILYEYMYQAKAYLALREKACMDAPRPKGLLRWKVRSSQGETIVYVLVSTFCAVLPQTVTHLSLHNALSEHMAGKPILTTEEWRNLFLSLIEGLKTFNGRGVCHNDIKEDNVLIRRVDNKFHPTLIDFGGCRSLSLKYHFPVFDSEPGQDTDALYPHTAPELFKRTNPHITSDLYGVAHLLTKVGGLLKLPALQKMAEEYKRLPPTRRKDHAFLHSEVTRCFADGKMVSSDILPGENRGMKRKREMDSSTDHSKQARRN